MYLTYLGKSYETNYYIQFGRGIVFDVKEHIVVRSEDIVIKGHGFDILGEEEV